jgi:hypothetical protein
MEASFISKACMKYPPCLSDSSLPHNLFNKRISRPNYNQAILVKEAHEVRNKLRPTHKLMMNQHGTLKWEIKTGTLKGIANKIHSQSISTFMQTKSALISITKGAQVASKSIT